MLNNLINLVKEHAGDAIINNPAIANKHKDAAIETTASSIMEGLKSQLGSGGISGLTSMFQGGGVGTNSSLVQNITQVVILNLSKKFGISSEVASGIAKSLIPTVMNQLVKKTNDPKDSSFDLQGVIGAVSGGGGIGSLLGKFFK